MTQVVLKAIPSTLSIDSQVKIIEKVKKLNACQGKKKITLIYLGGITNHGFKWQEENLFIRVPGKNADLFVNRKDELDTLEKLYQLKLYPKVLEAYIKGPLKGYKVEAFLAGEVLAFNDFENHLEMCIYSLKKLHTSGTKLKKDYDIFNILIEIIGHLKSKNQYQIPFIEGEKKTFCSIAKIEKIVKNLKTIRDKKFIPLEKKPCHNDITPTNFIKLKKPFYGNNYQIIDWEYAGMNDAMYDLAGIAAMLEISFVKIPSLIHFYFKNKEIKNQQIYIDRVNFYMPIIKLYYGLWAALQVCIGNESYELNELKNGWGPMSLSIFLKRYHSKIYQNLII